MDLLVIWLMCLLTISVVATVVYFFKASDSELTQLSELLEQVRDIDEQVDSAVVAEIAMRNRIEDIEGRLEVVMTKESYGNILK